MNWIDQVLDRDRWLALVNAVMNLRFSIKWGGFLTSWGPHRFQEGLCSMEVIS
jgi:hypothetical protein